MFKIMKQTNKVKPENNSIFILLAILIILIIIAGALLVIKFVNKNNTNQENAIITKENGKNKQEIAQTKTMSGKQRPIAVMLDNNINAVPQGGLEEADIVYEIIVEGGETRLMAIYKNKEDIR